MAVRPRGDAGETVHPGVDGLAGEREVDDVGDDHTAVGRDDLHDRDWRPQRSNDHGWTVLGDETEVVREPGVASVGDEVDGPRSASDTRGDGRQPPVQLVGRPAVLGGERAEHRGGSRGDHEVGP